MNRKFSDITWLAGLLEGEGSFGYYRDFPVIQLVMTDLDTIERAYKVLNCQTKLLIINQRGRTYYKTSIGGNKAIGWMFTLYSLMNSRRQNKIKEIILQWNNRQILSTRRNHKSKVIMINGRRTCIEHGLIDGNNARYHGNRLPGCKRCHAPSN